MRLTSIIHLYRTRLRARLGQELLALVGITVGVALVFAALVADTSLTGSVKQLTSGIVGQTRFQLAARSSDGFDQRLLGKVQRIPGVKAAAPALEARANVIGPMGRRSVLLVGGDPHFARLGGVLLRHFTAAQLAGQQAIGLPAPMASAIGVSLGGSVTMQVSGRAVAAPLGAELQQRDIGALVHSPVVLAPLAYAQRLADLPGRVTRIFVQPQRGRDSEVEAALRRLAGARLNVRPADADVSVFEEAAIPTNRSTALFSVFSAMVGFLFAFCATLLTVPQRRRLVADLRMAGYEPWVVVELLLVDALVLGVLGGGLGLAFGNEVSRHLFGSVPGYLAYVFPVGSQRIVTWQTIVIAIGAGILAACVAVLMPLRDILSRVPAPATASYRKGRAEPVAAVALGLLCLAVTTVILIAAPGAAVAGMVTLSIALLLLLPALLRLGAGALHALGHHVRSPVPILAMLELRSNAARMRTVALAATGAVAVFATVAIGGAHADLQRGLDTAARELDGNADVWATFPGATSAFATTPFADPRAARNAITRIPGVRAVRVYRGSFLDIGVRRVWVLAPPRQASEPIPPAQITHGGAALATKRIREGGWVVLSDALAKDAGVRIGDWLTLPSPVPTRLRVAALSTNLGWPSGAILLNADDYARAWGTRTPSALQIEAKHGASIPVLAAEVKRALSPSVPLQVETMRQRIAHHYAASREGLRRLTQISVLVLVSAVLAMAAAMGGMFWQRRPALAALKVHGFPEAELWRALLLESAMLLGTGCLIGAATGLYGQVLLSRALATVTGFPVFYSAAGLVAAGVLVVVTAIAVAMLALPGYLAVRVRPAPGTST
jgi:putative ABC transport system permease protein